MVTVYSLPTLQGFLFCSDDPEALTRSAFQDRILNFNKTYFFALPGSPWTDSCVFCAFGGWKFLGDAARDRSASSVAFVNCLLSIAHWLYQRLSCCFCVICVQSCTLCTSVCFRGGERGRSPASGLLAVIHMIAYTFYSTWFPQNHKMRRSGTLISGQINSSPENEFGRTC